MYARRKGVKLTAIAMGIALLLAIGCRNEATGPSMAEFDNERAALEQRLEKKRKSRDTQVAKRRTGAPEAKGASPAAFAHLGAEDFSYDPTDKRDPFRSFIWDRTAQHEDDGGGPLEQFDVSQLSVVAVVWKTGRARALIEDPSGQTYIIAEGARIGKNEGRVTRINDNQVVVKETYVDFLGEETIKDVELRIRRSEGG